MQMKKRITAMFVSILMITGMIMGSTVTTMAADNLETPVTTAHIKIDKVLEAAAGTLPPDEALDSASWTLTKVGFEAAYDPVGEVTDVMTPVAGDENNTTVARIGTSDAYTVTVPLNPDTTDRGKKTGSGIVDINIQNNPNSTDPNAAPFTRPGVYTYSLKENAPGAYYVDYDENEYFINIYVINVVDDVTNKPTGFTTIADINIWKGANGLDGSTTVTGAEKVGVVSDPDAGNLAEMTFTLEVTNTSQTADIIVRKRMAGNYADQANDIATFRVRIFDDQYPSNTGGNGGIPTPETGKVFYIEYYHTGGAALTNDELIDLYGSADQIVRYIPNRRVSSDYRYTRVKTKHGYTFRIIGVTRGAGTLEPSGGEYDGGTDVNIGEDLPIGRDGQALNNTTASSVYATIGFGLIINETSQSADPPNLTRFTAARTDGDNRPMGQTNVKLGDINSSFALGFNVYTYEVPNGPGTTATYYACNSVAPNAGDIVPGSLKKLYDAGSASNLYLDYVNEKNLVTPTGLNITMLPYIIAAVVVLTGMITFVVVKKKKRHNRAEGL